MLDAERFEAGCNFGLVPQIAFDTLYLDLIRFTMIVLGSLAGVYA
jgi:hypothetical protein